jgi:hypothetical protein
LRSSAGVDFGRGGGSTDRLTLFRSVASAGGSVVAEPECLRLREEDEVGEDDWSDDMTFLTTEREEEYAASTIKETERKGSVIV